MRAACDESEPLSEAGCRHRCRTCDGNRYCSARRVLHARLSSHEVDSGAYLNDVYRIASSANHHLSVRAVRRSAQSAQSNPLTAMLTSQEGLLLRGVVSPALIGNDIHQSTLIAAAFTKLSMTRLFYHADGLPDDTDGRCASVFRALNFIECVELTGQLCALDVRLPCAQWNDRDIMNGSQKNGASIRLEVPGTSRFAPSEHGLNALNHRLRQRSQINRRQSELYQQRV